MSEAATPRKRATARPSAVNVAGRPWTIEWVSTELEYKRLPGIDEDDDICGATYGQDLKIVIGTWTNIHIQRENLLHEIMHACVYGGKFDGALGDGVDHEEHYISGIDSPLLTTLRDNPGVTAWILGRAD